MTRLTVIAGPTAVGKGTVVRWILDRDPEIRVSISATTRFPRPGEVDGEHYFFVSDDEFDDMIAKDELLEYAVVHQNHRYGTPRKPVEDALAQGKQIILEIDVQGARQIKHSMPTANLIFIAPPSWEELRRRLEGRGTESSDQVEIRLQTAKAELEAASEFDHKVINYEVAECGQQVLDLMQAS
ncbi:MAG: guanylate kinase [Micrococcales bacterium]|nr:guanylate kinase [Actinomycetota bacterium]NCA07205.1 guanylate kinase [Micrococcales bacterium]